MRWKVYSFDSVSVFVDVIVVGISLLIFNVIGKASTKLGICVELMFKLMLVCNYARCEPRLKMRAVLSIHLVNVQDTAPSTPTLETMARAQTPSSSSSLFPL